MKKGYKLFLAKLPIGSEIEEIEFYYWKDIKEMVSVICSCVEIDNKDSVYLYFNGAESILITQDANSIYEAFCDNKNSFNHHILEYGNYEDASKASKLILGVYDPTDLFWFDDEVKGQRVSDSGVFE